MSTQALGQNKPVKPEQDKINTDRPDQTDAPYTLEPGYFQLETGILFDHFHSGSDPVIGKGLLRAGVLKGAELRLSIEDGYKRDKYIEESAQSTYPIYLGTKIAILKGHNWLPDMSIISYVEIPATAHESKQKGHWAPTLIATLEKKLSLKVLISTNIGIAKEAYSNDHNWAGTFVFHYQVTETIDLFAEYFASYQKGNNPDHNFDAGILYRIRNNMQFDLSFGSSLTDISPDKFVTLGYCIRWPK